ncbi:RHS repeat-associated core domain-containing protein [Streptomyces olivaceus]|uniref:RHS repeat-associated core domain-containing protein n=1 Tax=Streptomyces olivaceus TaxID=47716 RepID=UPI001CCF3535|nr:RHS repeat-associated core domain-containing protein [Streptomyces olivaceus]
MGLALAVSLLPQINPLTADAQAAGLDRLPTQTDLDHPVGGKDLKPEQYKKPDPARNAAVTEADEHVWPDAGRATVAVGGKATRAGKLPVRVAKADSSSPTRLEVAVADRKKAVAAGVDGTLLTVARADGRQGPGTVKVSVDYAPFIGAYGGDYASRLTLVQYPACVLTSPEKTECTESVPLESVNDTGDHTVTATAEVRAGAAADDKRAPLTVLAATAGDSGTQGSYAATSLAPSSKWSVSNASGAFTWSYPITLPPVPGGLAPEVGLSYNSQSIDGQTSATNNQGSWIGQGFSYEPGFIERRYKACADDGHDDTNGDQCWGTDNATLSIAGGASGELVKDDKTAEWRIISDDFSKIEKLTGASNGDADGEYWKVTDTDGTQFFFGLNHLSGWATGDESTNSAWTVPVYGDDSGEPCYKSTFADAHCNQAWRWNLDAVVDRHGNQVSYFYGTETNHYTQGLKTAENGKPYIRGGYLKRIDYGQRTGTVYDTKPAARINFSTSERCIGDLTDCEADDLTDSTAADWPDVPWDRNCKANTKCPGQNSPTFWTRKQLDRITTQIRTGDTTYQDVDSWTLGHLFTDNGDGSKSLWLSQVDHKGLTGTDVSVPSVKLHGLQLANRVGKTGDNIQPFVRFRLTAVESESGGVLSVDYAGTQCTEANLPKPGASTVRCYPVKWSPPGEKEPITDWFHKYVVSSVTDQDLIGGSPDQITSYTYLGDAGWRKAKPDGLADPDDLTWSDWRGYQRVRVQTSDGTNDSANTRTEHVYFQGLDGDATTGGGSRTSTVTDSEGTSHSDDDWKSGFELETLTYNGDTVTEKSVSTVWSNATATRAADWGTRTARYVRSSRTDTYEALASGGWRQSASTNSYDPVTGRLTRTADYGETAIADNRCTTTQYADSPDRHIYSLVAKVETVAGDCSSAPDRSKDVVSDDITLYDGTSTVGAAPTRGDPTTVKRLASHDGTTATYQTVSRTTYDDYGRPLTVSDADGKTTETTYTDTYGLATKKAETNPLGWTSTTEYAPQWGQPTGQTDMNGKRTDLVYDALGRLTAVWMPDRPKASDFSPSIRYTYAIRKDGPSYVRTEKLERTGTTYGDEYQLYDGLLRPRQLQTEGPDGGRLIADTVYDGSGRVVKVNDTYYAENAPATTLFQPDNVDINGQTVTEYDGAGRTTATIFNIGGTEENRTTYTYGGDRVHVDPPNGQTPTTTITDIRDRTVELRQYKSDAPRPEGSAQDYVSTTYAYTPSGRLKKVTDQEGNSWSYDYDQRGRQVRSSDPDAGQSTYTYDDLDRRTSATDSRDNTTTTTYDAIGRPTGTWQGPADSGTRLSVTRYDTIAKGELYGQYTYRNGAVYSSMLIPSLDATYQPTQVRYTISKTAEPELGGTYEFGTGYGLDGTVLAESYPAAGGLPGESVSFSYDKMQRPVAMGTSLNGAADYVTDAVYSPTSKLEGLELWSGYSRDRRTWLDYRYERGTERLLRQSVRVEDAASPALDTTYGYDDAGNIRSMADRPAGGPNDTQCLTYDALGRMTEAWTSASIPNGASGTGTRDAACTTVPSASNVGGVAPYWNTYTYDTTGNRTALTRHGIGDTATSTVSSTYGEGDAGPHQLTKTVTQTAATSTTPAVASQDTYTYDEAGNTTSRTVGGDTQTLTWNEQSDLTQIDEPDGTDTKYVYDVTGNRLIRETAQEKTRYLPGLELRLDKSTKTVEATRYYSFGGQTIAQRTTDGLTYLAGDHQGTAQLAISATDGATQRRRMDSFGVARDQTAADPSSWVNEKGFVGGTNDATTGLVHLGAREYDPSTGRFISVDPVMNPANPQQINGYAYGNNNPATHADPTGLCPFIDCPTRPCPQCQNTTPGQIPGPPRLSQNAAAAGVTLSQALHQDSAPAVKKRQQQAAQAQASAAKRRAQAVAKEMAQILADELGITDALDCFTTGSLGACAATAFNVVTSLVGGVVGKLATKYGLPWKWGKAAALGKRLWALGRKLVDAVGEWWDSSRLAKKIAATCDVSNSFTPDTRVLMADGTTRAIKDVDIGDEVMATDPETGKRTVQTVTAEIKGKGTKHLVRVTVDTDGYTGTKTDSVTATDGHPFWIPALHAWLDAADLRPGQWLKTSAGTYVQVTAVTHWTAPSATVHNLTVSNAHTYYVLAGATPVLVHNCGGGAADLGHLTDRADDLHSLIPSGGQRYRTTGVLHADGVGGGIDLSAVGARSNLTLIQRADSLDAGELAISMSNGAHAEVKLVTAAQHLGLSPGGIAASRPFCPACSQFLTNQGATLVSPRTALWLPPGVR